MGHNLRGRLVGLSRSLLTVLLRPIQFLIYWLTGFFPRRSDWWVFGSWSGHREADSPRALMEYVVRNAGEVKATWITADRTIARRMRDYGVDSRYRWSVAGIWAGIRAGVYLFDGITRDINHWLSRGAVKINLRHGVGTKRIERSIDTKTHRLFKLFHGNAFERAFWSIAIPWHLVRPDMSIASSHLTASFAAEAFGIDIDDVPITGLPRHDALFDDHPRPYANESERTEIKKLSAAGQPAFLFMPTFRDLAQSQGFDWLRLNQVAEQAGVVLHLKLHLVDELAGATDQRDFEGLNSLVWVNPGVDPIALYPHADGLITDFSSVAFDMLLLEKPVIYFIPDYDVLSEGRSLHLPFSETSPGPKCRTYEELGDALQAAVADGLGRFTSDYQSVLDHFYDFRDGNNSKRAFEAITDYLGKRR